MMHIIPTERCNAAKCMAPYFLIGYIVRKEGITDFTLKKPLLYLIVMGYIVSLLFYSAEFSWYNYSAYVLDKAFSKSVLVYENRFLCAVLGCVMIFLLFKMFVQNTRIEKKLSSIGKNTLDIYVLSMFIQEIIYLIFKLLLRNFSFLITDVTVLFSIGPAFFIVLYKCSVSFSKVIGRNRFSGFLLLGHRYKRI